LLCAHGKGGASTTFFLFFFCRSPKIFQGEAQAGGQKGRGLGGRNFRPPARFGWWVGVRRRRRRTSQSGFCSKKVRTLSSNCDQTRLSLFLGEDVCSLASPSARLASQISLYFGIKSNGRTKSKINFLSSRRRFGVRGTQQNEYFVSNFFLSAFGGTRSQFLFSAL